MRWHHMLALISVAVVPFAVAVATFVTAVRGRAPMWASIAVALAGLCLSFLFTTMLALRCSESYDVVLASKRLLTPSERDTLRGQEFLCPNVYRFERDGEPTCLVSDGDGGAFVGCG